MKIILVVCSILLVAIGGSNTLGSWTEVGDAGDLPGTAQVVTGDEPLYSITGTMNNPDVDMYEIYIYDPAGFSAYATGDDPQLFLFDQSGLGVYADDDSGAGLDALLPPGSIYSPTTPGIYYLAISEFNLDPYSVDRRIFSGYSATTPTGPGSLSPVIFWSGNTWEIRGDYTIFLTGAKPVPLPAPSSIFLGGIGAGLVGLLRRRKML